MSLVEASIVVKFGESVRQSDAFAVLELDEVANSYVDADGETVVKTTFEPTDVPKFLLHHGTKIKIQKIEWSAGLVQYIKNVTRSREQQLTFIREEVNSVEALQQLSYFPASSITYKWYGNKGVQITLTGRDIKIRDMFSATDLPAICDAKYTVNFRQYQLFPPAMSLGVDETFPIVVVFYMENVA